MTPAERQLLIGLFDRIRGQAVTPRDAEAEAFIDEAVRAAPFAPYLMAETVIVQDHALQAANQRLQQLEQRVHELESAAAQPSSSGSFLGALGRPFFGAQPGQPAAPSGPWGSTPNSQQGGSQAWSQPHAAAPGPWDASGQAPGAGGGFLKGALGAAAGVAGGVLLANSIRGLFAGGGNPYGIASGFGGGYGAGDGETVINNYYDSSGGQGGVYDASADFDGDSGNQDIDDFSDGGDNGGSIDV